MTKYYAAQILFAVVFVGVVTVHIIRRELDKLDDALCDFAGLS